MSPKIRTFFKTVKGAKALSFGEKAPGNFNFVDFGNDLDVFSDDSVLLLKQMNDSYAIEIEKDSRFGGDISELKLTNQGILTWEDHWIEAQSGALIDPMIKSINLQKNSLVHANFNVSRSQLEKINLEGNLNMRAVFIADCPKLEVLNVSNCPGLEIANLGNNRSIKALLARNCSLTSLSQEILLRDFTPIKTASSNAQFAMFRKAYETLLDLRGSEIDWSNRKVASKIRLLLCNNWLVLWDNPPPVSIIPPHMYAFFSSNLEDSLIKDYYNS